MNLFKQSSKNSILMLLFIVFAEAINSSHAQSNITPKNEIKQTTQNLKNMSKKWEKTEKNLYTFYIDNYKVGEMQIAPQSLSTKANCEIGHEQFQIKRTGIWKTTVEVSNKAGIVVAKTYNEKWFANSAVLEYGGKKYKLLLHNNPMAEFAIMDEDKVLLAYGLQMENKKPTVLIKGDESQNNPLLDFLLWYLFMPIASENADDNFTFLLLLSAQ